MTAEKLRLVKLLIKAIPGLTLGELHWIHRVVEVFGGYHQYTITKSDIFNETILKNFGDAMRVHHSFSAEPFSKDKFEYVLVEVLKITGRTADLAPKGNPGHDITVDGIKISLKTQADKGIKESIIWVSKFMELGKGQWSDKPEELEGLRRQFFSHLKSYDRILTLRALQKAPGWKYELVEIPKELLMRAKEGVLEMKSDSKQDPKPGYCSVSNVNGKKLFDLYFDGGTERKLQIKNLRKDLCKVHATWEFFIPQIEAKPE
ncbi:MAG: restriction endonuclease [Candidatus Marinimicrobia bacterium]|nr:restriction endonuclease [Candidatus Neomarinimicrobiota bacterium]MCF7839858.1 restriction endonuclease [Candidatus Neomarinimicrobiota bacterium]